MFLSRPVAAALASAALFAQSAIAHSTQRNPLSYLTRVEDAVIHTASHRVQALSSFELSFYLHDGRQKIRLSLEPNHDILAEDASVQYIGVDGRVHTVEPINRHDHKVYRGDAFVQHEGHAEWTNAGWARINVYRDGEKPMFEGAFRIDGDHHHVQTSTHYWQTRVSGDPDLAASTTDEDEYMVVWRDSDTVAASPSAQYGQGELKRSELASTGCTSDELLYNRDENNLVYRSLAVDERDWSPWSISPRRLFGRQIDSPTGGNGAGVNLTTNIGNPAGCPTSRKVALVGIVTDCTYTSLFASNASVRSNVIQQMNSASQVYESTFNISLGIRNLTIMDQGCPATPSSLTPWNVGCGSGTTITDRLNLFSKWRGASNDTNAYWTLLSNCSTGPAVGLAWLGQVCQQGAVTSDNETVAAANVVVRTSAEWQVIAHETGHTFGAVHDCVSSTCSDGTVTKQQCCPLNSGSCNANGAYIMNPSTGNGITNFSPCTVGNICSFLGRNTAQTQCLTNNKNVVTITGSQCGNGIVESGEDCDCGGASACANNPCCDAQTCKFTANSVCDPANEDCCTPQCQFAPASQVCRPSTGVCDPQETCSGTSPTCPADESSPDGTSCGEAGAGLACASGECTSRDLQCKTLMGRLTTGNDTYSCSNTGCVLSCASPEFGYNTCYMMRQNFRDGTPCQGGGKCSNGNCAGTSVGNEILDWIQANKPIFIPVVTIVGLVVLLAASSCVYHRCFGRRRPVANRAARARMPKPFGTAWPAPAPPQPQAMSGATGPLGSPPPPPPMAHSGNRWEPVPNLSYRFA